MSIRLRWRTGRSRSAFPFSENLQLLAWRLRSRTNRLIGSQLRSTLNVRASSSFAFAQFLYRGIGIELTADESGGLKFGPCFFSERYTPEDCWFMSAFDEGFLCGIMGIEGSLCFNCRLTEGAACCRAELRS